MQAAYAPPGSPPLQTWSVAGSTDRPISQEARVDGWWQQLGDPAINALTASAFESSPTLALAMARIDEAQATMKVNVAARVPTVGVSTNATRSQAQNTDPQVSGSTLLTTSASVGPTFSWELDLFGRVRHSVEAADSRLDARTADAAMTRLSLAADVADGVLSLRACDHSRAVVTDDIASREQTLALTRRRVQTGFAAPVDEARAVSGLASVRTNLATQSELCTRLVNSLVGLSGEDAAGVRQIVGATVAKSGAITYMPAAPRAIPELPATVLLHHPTVVSAEREAAAAWAEIGVARANRLPRLDLAAVLSGQWIRVLGSSTEFTAWSVSPSLTGTIFDGGAGAANVRVAQARYRSAVATLQSAVRTTVRDVEDALAAQESAASRMTSAGQGMVAARTTLEASQTQWEAGAINLFELEDSRRQYASAQDADISAQRDQAQAWIALVKATGGALTLAQHTAQESHSHD